MYDKETFIEKAKKRHGDKYIYSKVEYIDSKTKVCIICPEHGEFWQTPSSHLRGQCCPLCANKKRGRNIHSEEWIERANEIHKGKYDYSKAKIENSNKPVCIICPEHGEFWMTMNNHVNQKQGCPKCAGQNFSLGEIIEKFRLVHGDRYDYSMCERKKMNDKWRIICPEHGEFLQSATKHLKGQGCPVCGGRKKKSTGDFITDAKIIHGDKYDYSKVEYTNNKNDVTIICPKHGEFRQSPFNHLHGHGCPKCVETSSSGENEIVSWLLENNIKVISNNRDIIPPYEIDIFISEYNTAIEYNGLRWHCEKHCPDTNYHLNKTKMCNDRGVRLIHIFEDEWADKKEIVKSRVRNILNIGCDRIFARKCEIRETTPLETKRFLETNHIQGNCVSKYRYGLYYNNELVSVMTFGKRRKNMGSENHDGDYELLRFCNKLNTTVVGGAGKLLNHFIKKERPLRIVSYSDKRWSVGGMYKKLGFKLEHSSKPNYFYVIGNNRHNRFEYRKNILVEKYGCPENVSEHEFMRNKGWYRIYDCGTDVWILDC